MLSLTFHGEQKFGGNRTLYLEEKIWVRKTVLCLIVQNSKSLLLSSINCRPSSSRPIQSISECEQLSNTSFSQIFSTLNGVKSPSRSRDMLVNMGLHSLNFKETGQFLTCKCKKYVGYSCGSHQSTLYTT